jgi:hypothetical protein
VVWVGQAQALFTTVKDESTHWQVPEEETTNVAAQVAQVLTVWHCVQYCSVQATQAFPSWTWPLGQTQPFPAWLTTKVFGHTHKLLLERTKGDAQVWHVVGVAH